MGTWSGEALRRSAPALCLSVRLKPARRLLPALHSTPDPSSAEEDTPAKFITAAEDSGAPQGYLSSDMRSLGEGKQSRVLAYIALALVPCLFLVPFFLSRDFSPPTID